MEEQIIKCKLKSNIINYQQEIKSNYWIKLPEGNKLIKKIYKNIKLIIRTQTYLKLKVEGKGYYYYKAERGTFALKFGYAHRAYFFPLVFSSTPLSKTRFIFFSPNSFGLLRESLLDLVRFRMQNLYTGRGVRFARRKVFRKVGKVSSYR